MRMPHIIHKVKMESRNYIDEILTVSLPELEVARIQKEMPGKKVGYSFEIDVSRLDVYHFKPSDLYDIVVFLYPKGEGVAARALDAYRVLPYKRKEPLISREFKENAWYAVKFMLAFFAFFALIATCAVLIGDYCPHTNYQESIRK